MIGSNFVFSVIRCSCPMIFRTTQIQGDIWFTFRQNIELSSNKLCKKLQSQQNLHFRYVEKCISDSFSQNNSVTQLKRFENIYGFRILKSFCGLFNHRGLSCLERNTPFFGTFIAATEILQLLCFPSTQIFKYKYSRQHLLTFCVLYARSAANLCHATGAYCEPLQPTMPQWVFVNAPRLHVAAEQTASWPGSAVDCSW